MIIARIIGGLGNQLFQYAVGRHLAKILGVDLKLDVSGFNTYKLHAYSLAPFNVKQVFSTAKENARMTGRGLGLCSRALLRITGQRDKFLRTHIAEAKQFYFDPAILTLPDGVYLDGYWQTEKYFLGIQDIIHEEFALKSAPAGRDLELAEQISSCESVSLHVRRGDYVTNSQTYKACGVCPLAYYEGAVKWLSESVRSPQFFVFSDDIEWSRKNLSMPFPVTFVSHNGPDKNYEDLRLMSLCKHQIIANSSFSWWGAWLNRNPGKKVVAPKHWFKTRETIDLIPAGWMRI